MPPLVVPDVCRFAVHGKIGAEPWVNIVDVAFSEGAPARYERLDELAVNILDGYRNKIRPQLSSAWQVESVSWVDLDNPGGAVGSINDTPTGTFPLPGAKSGDALPANVAVMIVKNTTGGRNTRRGRMFIPGCTEADSSGNQMPGSATFEWDQNLPGFLSAVNAPISGTAMQMCVVHTPATAAPSYTAVTSLSVDAKFATQRRRLRR